MLQFELGNLSGTHPLLFYTQHDDTAWPAFLQLSHQGVITFGVVEDKINLPLRIFHEVDFRWYIPGDIAPAALRDFVRSQNVISLLKRIHAGHSLALSALHRVHCGNLTQDARRAREALDDLIFVTLWQERTCVFVV